MIYDIRYIAYEIDDIVCHIDDVLLFAYIKSTHHIAKYKIPGLLPVTLMIMWSPSPKYLLEGGLPLAIYFGRVFLRFE